MLDNTNEWAKKWRVLVKAAKRTLSEQGYALEKVPGRGKSNIWRITKDGKTQIASIRTTQDRWIAFPPLNGGTQWKTLDDADLVVVATVDDCASPKAIETYIFPADEIQKRFHDAYHARIEAGQVVTDNFGMWVALDKDKRNIPASIGSGVIDKYPPVAIYGVKEFAPENPNSSVSTEPKTLTQHPETPKTIGEVMALARVQIATIAGVAPEVVKLDLKVEY